MFEISKTLRGFEVAHFTDTEGTKCMIQQSSQAIHLDDAPGSSFLWIGLNETTQPRMHLDRYQVAELAALLTRWLAFNSFEKRR